MYRSKRGRHHCAMMSQRRFRRGEEGSGQSDGPTQDLVGAEESHFRPEDCMCTFRNGHVHMDISKEIVLAGADGILGREHEVHVLGEGGPNYTGC